ncbi:MAG: ATP phosphoribosyltransferase [Fimbriimonadaceae bacterium]|nr:ATP phosphoribosyltransferase [Fimbriimonadaceae bacterium]QYK59160.1 MAG: ATP phosphoribosyltransferase [Fimbriimonadaceae bacterium]
MVRLGLPKGRMWDGVARLMRDAGLEVRVGAREYRPSLPLDGFEAKIQKPQNIIEMLDAGTRDLGFAGADWVAELGADVVELLDTGLDRVRLVAAAPVSLLEDGRLPRRRLVVASEYERLTGDWILRAGLDARFVRSYGATEVFPPEDADVVVDITATGATLEANGLAIVEDLGQSSTRLYASRPAMDDPAKREAVESFVVLVSSVLEARRRVMVELNVEPECLEAVVAALPAMRQPTVAQLHGQRGFAVKAAILRSELPALVVRLRQCGGSDIVVSEFRQVVP